MTRLILIPTEFERRKIVTSLSKLGDGANIPTHVCGFGQIAAASRTATLVAQLRPGHVILAGIAGALSDRLEIGNAYDFSSVTCDGVGIGWGEHFQSSEKLGWAQWDAAVLDTTVLNPAGPSVGDSIGDLASQGGRRLLSVCAGSSDPIMADQRRWRYPDADAEDMEGFGVAMSCRLARIPLTIIRGISNHAGDRDHQSWKTDAALKAVAQCLLSLS